MKKTASWRTTSTLLARPCWFHALLLLPLAAQAGDADRQAPKTVKGATKILATMTGGNGAAAPQTGTGGAAGQSARVRPKAKVTARALNVRTGPGTGYRVQGRASRGDQVQVLRQVGSWFEVLLDGIKGWVHGAYLDQGAGAGADADAGGGASGASSPSPASSSSSSASSPTPSSPSASSPSAPTKSRAGFIQLPNSGPGYFGYYPASKRWGTPRLVYGIQRVASRFASRYPNAGRLGIGDISLQNGGPIAGHASHRNGVDVDVTPLRNDGGEARVTIHQSAYSRTLTQAVLDLFVAELPVRLIFFNDSRTRHTQRWPNHDNHFHLRIR